VTDTGPVVIDASVALALALDEPEAPQVRDAIAGWISEGRSRVVPAHFWLEVVSRLSRPPGGAGAFVLEAIHRLDSLGLEAVDIDRPLLVRAIDLMERTGLTVYDAAYLALADRLDGELATFDTKLGAAAGDRLCRLYGQPRSSERPAAYEREVTWPAYAEASAYLARLRADALAGSSG
jgi:predicted nucleic acid-binding protein